VSEEGDAFRTNGTTTSWYALEVMSPTDPAGPEHRPNSHPHTEGKAETRLTSLNDGVYCRRNNELRQVSVRFDAPAWQEFSHWTAVHVLLEERMTQNARTEELYFAGDALRYECFYRRKATRICGERESGGQLNALGLHRPNSPNELNIAIPNPW